VPTTPTEAMDTAKAVAQQVYEWPVATLLLVALVGTGAILKVTFRALQGFGDLLKVNGYSGYGTLVWIGSWLMVQLIPLWMVLLGAYLSFATAKSGQIPALEVEPKVVYWIRGAALGLVAVCAHGIGKRFGLERFLPLVGDDETKKPQDEKQ